MNAVVAEDIGAEPPQEVTPEIMRALQAELPLNDFGLPVGIYRPDLLPLHLYIAPGQLHLQTLATPSHGVPSEEGFDQPESKTVVTKPNAPLITELPEIQADPFSLLSGMGDGLPDAPLPVLGRGTDAGDVENPIFNEYRIAGFPSASIQTAFVPLQYDEGYPAFATGSLFWQQLPYEPQDSYLMFERYMLMSQGVNPSFDGDEPDEGRAASGTRTIEGLVAQMNIAGDMNDTTVLMMVDKLRHSSALYYWGLRARAYDLFRVTQFRQQQELRAIETHDDHYIQSRKLRARLMEYMGSEEEFWDLMTPKTGIDMFKTLTQLERISVGLPAAGPATGRTGEEDKTGQSFEVAFRTIAQTHAGDSANGDILDEEGNILDSALEDSAATEILQQLIIRTSLPSRSGE